MSSERLFLFRRGHDGIQQAESRHSETGIAAIGAKIVALATDWKNGRLDRSATLGVPRRKKPLILT